MNSLKRVFNIICEKKYKTIGLLCDYRSDMRDQKYYARMRTSSILYKH